MSEQTKVHCVFFFLGDDLHMLTELLPEPLIVGEAEYQLKDPAARQLEQWGYEPFSYEHPQKRSWFSKPVLRAWVGFERAHASLRESHHGNVHDVNAIMKIPDPAYNGDLTRHVMTVAVNGEWKGFPWLTPELQSRILQESGVIDALPADMLVRLTPPTPEQLAAAWREQIGAESRGTRYQFWNAFGIPHA